MDGKINFSELLNIHAADECREPEIHSSKLLVPEPTFNALEITIEKLKHCKSPGPDLIPSELLIACIKDCRQRYMNL
jgi:hypothetical protein